MKHAYLPAVLVILIAFAVGVPAQSKPGTAETSKTAASETSTKHKKARKKHAGKPSATACVDQGSDDSFIAIDCPPEAIQACHDGVSDVDVDAFLNGGTDAAACVLQGSGNTITWTSKQGNNFKVRSMFEKSVDKRIKATPFLSGPPYGAANGKAQSSTLDPNLPKLSAGKCYLFKSQIQVPKTGGGHACYDPHIYVGCDTCTSIE